jgi:hypothetical protein
MQQEILEADPMAFSYDEVYTEMKKATKKVKRAKEAQDKKVGGVVSMITLVSQNTLKVF